MLVLQVICNGEEVLTTAGTKETYTVEIWSGNHPFYQGADNVALKEEGRVAAFNRKYAVGASIVPEPERGMSLRLLVPRSGSHACKARLQLPVLLNVFS